MADDTDTDDIFDADGALSREYLLRRGYCCRNGCRNCPYGFRKAKTGEAHLDLVLKKGEEAMSKDVDDESSVRYRLIEAIISSLCFLTTTSRLRAIISSMSMASTFFGRL